VPEVPLIFLVYNRPDLTKITFNFIKSVKPRVLFLISDGPKNKQDHERIKKVRSIISQINWKCKVYKRFRKRNIGNKKSCEDGIRWLFSKYNTMIYIEDDTLPSKDFIKFAEQNLIKYKNNEEVSIISAQNEFKFSKYLKDYKASYVFSPLMRLPPFATWKRVWSLYEPNIRVMWYKNIFSFQIIRKFNNFLYYVYFALTFNWAAIKAVDTWDFAFHCSLVCKLKNHPLAIIPSNNLSKNIGMNHSLSSHSVSKNVEYFNSKQKIGSLKKITHPKEIRFYKKFDDLVFFNFFFPKTNYFSYMSGIFLLYLRYAHSFLKILKHEFKNKSIRK